MSNISVNLRILETFLQIVVYGFVGDLADEREIRYTNFLLFRCLKHGALNGAFILPAGGGGFGILLATRSLGDGLDFVVCQCLILSLRTFREEGE